MIVQSIPYDLSNHIIAVTQKKRNNVVLTLKPCYLLLIWNCEKLYSNNFTVFAYKYVNNMGMQFYCTQNLKI